MSETLGLTSDASDVRKGGGGRGATALPTGHAGRVTLPTATREPLWMFAANVRRVRDDMPIMPGKPLYVAHPV